MANLRYCIFLTLSLFCLYSRSQAQEIKTEIQKRYTLDPTSKLESRVQPASEDVIKMFQEAGMSPKEHTLSDAERQKVMDAFAFLPALHQKVLKDRLRSINFLDNMPNTALTSTLNPDEEYKLFDITFRADVLHQTVSEWITEKELTCFDTTHSDLKITIQAGRLNAFVYILLHETTHVVDGALDITPHRLSQLTADSLLTGFVAGIWAQHAVVSKKYSSSLLDGIAFRRGGKKLPIISAKEIYEALKSSPFVSLYSRNSWNEDLAEFLSVYHFTQKLEQPFTVTIRKGNTIIFSHQPFKSKLVRKRMRFMERFYQV